MNSFPLPRDVAVGAVGVLLGAVFIVEALRITPDPSAFSVLGPRVAPLVIGIGAVLCSSALIVQSLWAAKRGEEPDHGLPEFVSEEPVHHRDAAGEESSNHHGVRRRLMVIFALFTVYLLVFIPLGYLLSTFAFLVAVSTYVDREKWRRNSVFAAVFSVAVYFVFVSALRVQLPPGILG